MSLHPDTKTRECRGIDIKPMSSFLKSAPAQSVLTRLAAIVASLVECVTGNLNPRVFFVAVTLPYLV
jgi:NaMN:DMB phosphoribosyltransferase